MFSIVIDSIKIKINKINLFLQKKEEVNLPKNSSKLVIKMPNFFLYISLFLSEKTTEANLAHKDLIFKLDPKNKLYLHTCEFIY